MFLNLGNTYQTRKLNPLKNESVSALACTTHHGSLQYHDKSCGPCGTVGTRGC